MKTRVNFFDLGMFDGAESLMFLEDIKGLNVDPYIYGFEAYQPFYENICELFSDNDNNNVNINNLAISNSDSYVKLFLEKSGQGNSIYESKNNVDTKNFIKVKSVSFADWVIENVPNYKDHFNILRFNIEGAELPLMEDIIDKKIHKNFKIFLGSHVGVDIKKVGEIKDKFNYYVNLLKSNNINIELYCKDLTTSNVNLHNLIKENLK
jgi:FkbM family methyltransferase